MVFDGGLTVFGIAVLGIAIGIFSNPLPFFGSTSINFLFGTFALGYQTLAQKVMQFPVIPETPYIFILGYLVGTFTIKFISLLPIPIAQQFAIPFQGTK